VPLITTHKALSKQTTLTSISATRKQSSAWECSSVTQKPPGQEKALKVPPSDDGIFKRGINGTVLFSLQQ